jgi:hypothetical protein
MYLSLQKVSDAKEKEDMGYVKKKKYPCQKGMRKKVDTKVFEY